MPTTTTTVTKHSSRTSQFPLKLSSIPSDNIIPPQSSTSATLRSLYTRAARAFLLRDVETTSSLLLSAFSLIKPPHSISIDDPLSDDRKKWDILRITFESTVYTSPPPPSSPNKLPEAIRYLLTEAPQALVSSMYSRSLSLFLPSSESKKSSMTAAYLPTQVLTTLVYCSLKLGVPDIGRVIIEDWLAFRQPYVSSSTPSDAYDKILELYCLRVLPKLGQWDYIREFLEYESELPVHRRAELKTCLQDLYNQEMTPKSLSESALRSTFQPPSNPLSPRTVSPAPSSSSSSSVSTASTHTVVPITPRGRSMVGLSSISRHSSDESTTSSRTEILPSTSMGNGHQKTTPTRPTNHNRRSRSKSPTRSSSSSIYSSLPRTRIAQELSRSEQPSVFTLIKASLMPYLTNPRLPTLLLIFILIPFISLLLRIRRRRRVLVAPIAVGAIGSNADVVRRRLLGTGHESSGIAQRAWDQVVSIVTDAVKMAGSGLV